MDDVLKEFPALQVLRFEFSALNTIHLPPYSGSAWHGVFGKALRQVACTTKADTCDGCPLIPACAYTRIFESPRVEAASGRRGYAKPNPYAFEVQSGTSYRPGTKLTLGLTLVGESCDDLPLVIAALRLAGSYGLGRDLGRFELSSVRELTSGRGAWTAHALSPAATPTQTALLEEILADTAAPTAVRIEMRTPLRIKRRGKLVGAREFGLNEWIRQLVWRINDLSVAHGKGTRLLSLNATDQILEDVTVKYNGIRWRDWERYSSRQRTRMNQGGLVGDMWLSGDGLKALWPLLRLGRWLHLGKSTTMGLGDYSLHGAASLPDLPESRQGRILPNTSPTAGQ